MEERIGLIIVVSDVVTQSCSLISNNSLLFESVMNSAVTNSIRSSAIQGVSLTATSALCLNWFFFPLMCIIINRLHSIRIWNFLITDLNLMLKFLNGEQRKDGYFTNEMLPAT